MAVPKGVLLMIEKQRIGSDSILVTFRLPPEITADTAHVVGDFNDWSNLRDQMDRVDVGFVDTIVLRPGRAYRFRYLLDDHCWVNDWAADAYLPNEFGGEDSVIDLREPPAPTVLPT